MSNWNKYWRTQENRSELHWFI